MSGFVFLSLVGTQPMAVLQPLEACLRAGMPVGSVILHASDRTLPAAERIRAFCMERGHPPAAVETADLRTADLAAIVRGAARDGVAILLNVDGGPNFAAAGMALALAGDGRSRIVAPGRKDVVLVNPVTWARESLPLPPPMPVADLLRLQGADWEAGGPARGPLLADLCARHGIPLPDHHIMDVRMGGILFDLVWNAGGNRLAFLTSLPSAAEEDNAARRLARARAVAAWAAGRSGSGQLYDRDCHVLCPDDTTLEHVAQESGGKALARRTSFRKEGKLAAVLRDILSGSAAGRNAGDADRPGRAAGDAGPIPAGTLILALGPNEAPTLNAIAAHGLPNVILCHTPDAPMRELAGRVRDLFFGGRRPVSVRLLETDIRGLVLPGRLGSVGDAGSVHVNVTPGSKGQGAFLALWAARNGCGVWSLAGARLRRLDAPGEALPAAACDPVIQLRLRHPGLTVGDRKDDPAYGAILAHMRACLGAGVEWNPNGGCDAGGFSLGPAEEMRAGGEGRVIRRPDGRRHPFTLRGGEWLEGLTAHALRAAGAIPGHVHERIRIPWNERILQRMRDRRIPCSHRLDMDVLAAWKGVHVMISCKGGKNARKSAAAAEAAAAAGSVGRFVLPLLCRLSCRERHFVQVGGGRRVMVFGWRDLCRPEELAALLDEAWRDARSMA